MTDEKITEYRLQKECDELAQEIFDEITDDMPADETPEDRREDMMDRVHETVDGHQWVIYYAYAHEICQNCDIEQGEAFLEDVGCAKPVTYDLLAVTMAYGELHARVSQAVDKLVNDWEDERDEEAA